MNHSINHTKAEVGDGVDLVHVDDLVFFGRHGVGSEERAAPQKIKVSIVLGVDTRNAGRSDRLDDTVNYQLIKDAIQIIVEQQSYALVEAMADRIWNTISTDSRIRFAEISIRKMHVWNNGIPGVTVFRRTVDEHGLHM